MQPRPKEVEVRGKKREEPPDSATSETRNGQQQLDWFRSSTSDYLPDIHVDLEARGGRWGPNPLTWDPSPGSKAFMTGKGGEGIRAVL